MEKWSEEAWSAAAHIFEAIKELPFIKELANGSLSQDRFMHYINQDKQYLETYTRMLAHIASRLTENSDVETFLAFATGGIEVEKSLHESFAFPFHEGKSPACEFYTSYLKSHAMSDIAVECAAVLPCFWIYEKVGKHIFETASLQDNPYSKWIQTYNSETFEQDTRRAIEICDRLASQSSAQTRASMTEAFVMASKLEWLFWDSAYKQENWKF